MRTLIFILLILVALNACVQTNAKQKSIPPPEEEQIDYWYNNEAEISSYALKQARYGEMHEGNAVLVFVTEPFSKSAYVKADNPSASDLSVMKLNFSKKFNTGIYPYSMMTSTFFPFQQGEHSLKISSSSQEWCGHTFMELIQKEKYEIKISSYFEGETTQLKIGKTYLEDDFWTQIRISPDALPTGKILTVPSFFFLRLAHKETKAYNCMATHLKGDTINTYQINYPKLERTLTINYENTFPYRIITWEETYFSGWGEKRKKLTSSGKLIKTIKSDYWNKHNVEHAYLREELGLR